MKYSHKLFIAGGKSKGVFDNVVWHLDNGAEIISTSVGKGQVAYILRKLVPTYFINEIKEGDTPIHWQVAYVKPSASDPTTHDFEFEDDAKAFVKEAVDTVWQCPVPMEMVSDGQLDNVDKLRFAIESWRYISESAHDLEEYQLGLNKGLDYALEELNKLFPIPDGDNAH